MLNKHKVTMETTLPISDNNYTVLDKSLLYTFHVAIRNFALIPIVED